MDHRKLSSSVPVPVFEAPACLVAVKYLNTNNSIGTSTHPPATPDLRKPNSAALSWRASSSEARCRTFFCAWVDVAAQLSLLLSLMSSLTAVMVNIFYLLPEPVTPSYILYAIAVRIEDVRTP